MGWTKDRSLSSVFLSCVIAFTLGLFQNCSRITEVHIVREGVNYVGITSASAVDTTTVALSFPPGDEHVAEFRIYGTARGITTLFGTINRLSTSATLPGLRSGTTYAFRIVAISRTGVEDGNIVTATVQTPSISAQAYRGIFALKALGLAPTAPAGTPSDRQVSLSWLPFQGVSSGNYVVVRAARGAPLDMTTTQPCAPSITSSCLACVAAGTGPQSCTDDQVGPPPQRYDYAVTLSFDNWPEELPVNGDIPYRIGVAVPPDNMVLVHRDAANYEMCRLLGKTSDPNAHQSCTGYDFGHDLFVDRWTQACRWTNTADGGHCGPGAAGGDCFGNSGTPDNSIGANGNIFYASNTGTCYVKKGAAWLEMNAQSLLAADRDGGATHVPGTTAADRRPPLVNIDQARAWDTCHSHVDPDYGPKRIWRQREVRVAAASPTLPGEQNALDETGVYHIESYGGHGPGVAACNSDNLGNGFYPEFPQSEFAGSSSFSGPVKSYVIGSSSTSRCVSRWGFQDYAGNVRQWTSDQITCSTTTHSCLGVTSSVDASNSDMAGFAFDGAQGPGGTSAGQTASSGYTSGWVLELGVPGGSGMSQGYGSGYYNPTMGLPLVTNTSTLAVPIATLAPKFHGMIYFLNTDFGSANRGLYTGGYWDSGANAGRWYADWTNPTTYTSPNVGVRCVLQVP